MRSTITLLIGLSTLLLFISIHSISYVNAQSGLNNVSDNKSTNANSAVESENLDPFTLRGSSNDASSVNNDQSTDADGGSSTSSSSDDNNDASTSSSSDNDDGDKSSKEDKNSDSKDDKKFELPFP
jgi:hypothetical protein